LNPAAVEITMNPYPGSYIQTHWRAHLTASNDPHRRSRLRKLVFFATLFAFSLLANLASAQQADAMFGFGTIMAPNAAACNPTSGCPERGGLYPHVGFDVIFRHRVGFGYNVAWKGSQGIYGGTGGLPFRPIINDFNLVFQPRLNGKAGLDLFAGIGWQSTRFYSGTYTCNFVSCINYTSSNHFLVDAGGGIRYYVMGHMFVRPEVRFYNIRNNTVDFTSGNIVRVGASIGYTIGPD
jgi:hypothetical protein